jgi:folate-binding protein YgfZ
MLESPVLEMQKQAGATVTESYGWSLPSVYSSPEKEYQAATKGAGLLDRSYIGRLKVSGKDAIDLLNRLSTNKLEDLETGRMMGTVLTSNKGRIIDLLFVLRLDDHLLVFTGPETRQKVAEWIDFYTFVEEVSVHDATEETAMLSLMGPEAGELLGAEAKALSRYESTSISVSGVDALAVRTDFAGLAGYDLVVEASQAGQLWQALADTGATPVGTQTLDAIRIEHGIPAYGTELSEDYNPLEANLLDFISFNKGCYIGQEVVARLNTYKKVQKHLVGLSWDSDSNPTPGTSLYLEGKKAGAITSAARSPESGKGIGLGYVRKTQARDGVRLTAEEDAAVLVEELSGGNSQG